MRKWGEAREGIQKTKNSQKYLSVRKWGEAREGIQWVKNIQNILV